MTLKLHITKPGGGPEFDNEVRPTTDVVVLGRRIDSDVVLDDGERQVSGRHVKIECKGGTFLVTDLGSSNGTMLDGRKLEPHQPAPLRHGSLVQVGLLQIDVILDQSSADLGKTLVHRDPKRSAAILSEQLSEIYAGMRQVGAQERNAEMRRAVSSVLGDSDPAQARVVLEIVRQQHLRGREGGVADVGSDLGLREELYRSGFESLRDLSQLFLETSEFGSAEDVGKFARLIQQALQGMFGWIATALQGRAEFKEQFGAEVTQIFFHQEHNPLKSGGGAQEIGRFLLDWSSGRNVGEIRSNWEQALRDLSMHQFSLLRAVQETLRKVFAQLDPDALEKQAEANTEDAGWLKKMTGGESPWEIYKGAFAQMRDEQSRFFDGVIYPTMKGAYIEAHQQYLEHSKPSSTGSPSPISPSSRVEDNESE